MSDDPNSICKHPVLLRWRLIHQLRIPWEGMGEMANQQRAEAAVQMEKMNEEINEWQYRFARMMIERDKAESERDEARREVCRCLTKAEGGTPEEHAADQGWDCFKEKP